MNWQQKTFKYGRIFYRAFTPVLLLLFVPGVVRYSAMAILGTDPDDLSGNFYYALGLCLYLWLFVRKQKKRGKMVSDWIGFHSREEDGEKIALYVVSGIALNMMLTAVLSLLARFSWMQSYQEQTHGLTESTNAILVYASICVLAPIAEEVTLRGAMLSELLSAFSPRTAILIVSLVFSVGHGSLIWILYTFFFGVYLAQTTLRENGRLIFPIALHGGFNLPTLVSYFVYHSRRTSDFLERYPSFYLLYALIGVLLFVWSGRALRSNSIHLSRYEGEKTTL